MSRSDTVEGHSIGEQLAELGKRRGFFFPSNEVYGGTAGFYTYGPQGTALKRHVESAWRDRFTVREGNYEIESPTITPSAVLAASGHLDGFDDMLIECVECGETHRADHLIEEESDVTDVETLPIPRVEELVRTHDISCPNCGASLADEPVEEFNLMFETTIGPGNGSRAFLRPETAQGIFVEFPRLAEYARNQLPFGVTQIGSGYRNEISPRKGLVRVREFTMAELELFIDPERNRPDLDPVADVPLTLYSIENQDAAGIDYETRTVATAVGEIISSDWIAYYLGITRRWYERIGIDMNRLRFRQHLPGERAHYASDCWDAEVEIDGDWIEIAGFAYRGDYDLTKHADHSEAEFTVFEQYDEPIEVERPTIDPDMSYFGPKFGKRASTVVESLEQLLERDRTKFEGDEVVVEIDGEPITLPIDRIGYRIETVTEAGEHVRPHVVEPSFGVGRTVYTVLAHTLREDEVDGEQRTVLALPPTIAPTFVGVFPLMARDGLGRVARDVAAQLRSEGLEVTYDDTGNIGRRYRRQDEIGTPYCVTIDYRTLDDDTVTIRDRDSTVQARTAIPDLPSTLAALGSGARSVSEL